MSNRHTVITINISLCRKTVDSVVLRSRKPRRTTVFTCEFKCRGRSLRSGRQSESLFGILSERMLFLNGLFHRTTDAGHLALDAAGDHGEKRSEEHHESPDPNPSHERIDEDLNEGLSGVLVVAGQNDVQV